MTSEQGYKVLTLLQTFWPIDWNPKMSKRHETAAVEELQRAFKDYEVDTVLEAIRALAKTTDRPASLRQIIDRANALEGLKAGPSDYTLEQYIINFPKPGEPWPLDADGYEIPPKWVYVRKYTDGHVAGPPGVKVDRQQLIWQHIIKPGDADYAKLEEKKKAALDSVQQMMSSFKRADDIAFGEEIELE